MKSAIISRILFRIALMLAMLAGFSTFCHNVDGMYCVQSNLRRTSGSSESRGNQWSESCTLVSEDGNVKLPAEGQLERVAVQWQPPEVDELGHICKLSGLLVVDDNEGGKQPIDWPQLIAVHLSEHPGESWDWSKGVDDDSVASETEMVNADGTFTVSLDLREFESGMAENRNLQVGITVAKQSLTAPEELKARVSSSQPALESSIRMLEIPQGKEHSEVIRLIDRASGWPDRVFTAVDLIRAANALQKMDREQAATAMEDYSRMTSEKNGYSYRDSYILYGLIQCAFEPADPADRLPRPKYPMTLGTHNSQELAALWPRAPIEITSGIPWLLGSGVGLAGVPSNPITDLQWVRRYGKLRDEALRPADNPLVVAEAIMNEPRFALLDQQTREQAIAQLKEQSYAMVADLLPEVPINNWGRRDLESNWEMLLEASTNAEIFWDESKQCYRAKQNQDRVSGESRDGR